MMGGMGCEVGGRTWSFVNWQGGCDWCFGRSGQCCGLSGLRRACRLSGTSRRWCKMAKSIKEGVKFRLCDTNKTKVIAMKAEASGVVSLWYVRRLARS